MIDDSTKDDDAAQAEADNPDAAIADNRRRRNTGRQRSRGPSHDAFFKWTFSNIERAKAELKSVLPAGLVKKINWDTLRLTSPGTSDKLLKHFAGDLFFSVEINGKPAVLHVIFEHQSKVEGLMPIRLLGYWVRSIEWLIRQRGERRPLPAVIPVVLYHGESAGTPRRVCTSCSTLSS
jgi:predicted transposase/invertase (TIGR01784 family)